jgi:hypothetical protein
VEVVKFIDPPHGGKQVGRPRKYMTDEVLSRLDSRPGQWALLEQGASDGLRATIAKWCSRHDGYEATSRKTSPKTFDVYVRRVED